ncbi:hypothetical protein Tco_0984891 [Tanacetum coccineum]
MATLNEPSPQGIGSGSGPRFQVTILRGAAAQTRVLALETTKTAQAKEIASLKKRVKKLERKRKSRTQGRTLFKIGTSKIRSLGEEDASKQGRNLKQRSIFGESDVDEDLDAVSTAKMEVNTAEPITTASAPITTVGVSVSTAKPITPPTTTTPTVIEDEYIIIAQTLIKMKSEKSKAKGVTILAKQREEDANIAEWDNVQAMMDVDYELAARLQAEEQGEISIEESFEEIQMLFEKEMKRVNIFVDMDAELVKCSETTEESSSKKARDELEKESTKKQKKLVKTKHGYTRPEEAYEKVLWGDLKVMFEPDVEDDIWRNLQGQKILLWKLYDSCGIHFVRFENMHIYMLVEKRYPLSPTTITDMLNRKLQADYWNETCYQLLKLITKQLKNP